MKLMKNSSAARHNLIANWANSHTMHIGMKRLSFESWANPTWGNLLITLPWGIGILVAVFGWSADHTIAKRERTTIGVITAHKASRSDRYLYTFSVNGEKLEGSSGTDDRHNVGDQVTVFYDPIDPNKSDLRDYKDLALRDFGLVPFALTGIAGITWYIWYARSRNKPIPDTRANFPRKKLT